MKNEAIKLRDQADDWQGRSAEYWDRHTDNDLEWAYRLKPKNWRVATWSEAMSKGPGGGMFACTLDGGGSKPLAIGHGHTMAAALAVASLRAKAIELEN